MQCIKTTDQPHTLAAFELIFTEGREIVIATKHQKEKVIAPLLKKAFQFRCSPATIDTDQLGTFTGEIERTLSPLDAARKKCEIALDVTGADLAISSEGSFGAHPFIPFCKANEEFVLLFDRQNGLEIFGKSITLDTNFDGCYVSNYKETINFSKKVGFPEHALILRDKKNGSEIFAKGISEWTQLEAKVSKLFRNYSQLWIETDMRAMYNPTRMKAIGAATENLIEKMKSLCPSCDYPGFWVDTANAGLPCSYCGSPTNSTLSYEYACMKCDYRSVKMSPHNKQHEEPMYCDRCNP